MRVTLIETPGSSMGEYAIVYDMQAWPKNTVRNRGWRNAHVLYERDATADEVEEQRQSPRYLAYRYKSWDQVVADERKYAVDAVAEQLAYRQRIHG